MRGQAGRGRKYDAFLAFALQEHDSAWPERRGEERWTKESFGESV